MEKNLRSITRPNQERFDMTEVESKAFWLIVLPQYSHYVIRTQSFHLYCNTTEKAAQND